MAMGKADGSIIINTKILESGFNKGLSSMKNKLSGFGRAVEGSMSSMDSSLGRTAEKVQRIGKLIAGAFAIGKLIQFGKEALQLGSDLAEMENVTGTVFPNMTKEIREWSDAALDNYGLTRTMAKNYVGTFGAMSKAFGFSERKAFEMSTALAGLSGDVASFYNLSQDEAFSKLKSIFTGETEALKSLGVVMTQSALDQYALANGWGRTVSQMTEAEKVELRMAFVTDKLNAASGDFVKTQDSWANQTKRLSANFQELKTTIGQGLINLFTPVIKGINTLLSYLHTAARAFNTFTATLMGKKSTGGGGGAVAASAAASETMSGVADSASNVADSTYDAADATDDYASAQKAAQKAANSYLSTLDEVNRYTTQQAVDTGSSSSPKSGKTSGTPSSSGASGIPSQLEQVYDDSAFAVEEVAEEFSEFADKLRKAFEAGDWEGLGQIIGEKINEILTIIKDKISWDNVGPYITKFVDAFTRTFNSLVKTIDWHLLGETIATGINTIIYTLKLLITGIDWGLLGRSFAAGVNGLAETVDWEALGELLGERFLISWRLFAGFVSEVNWGGIGGRIGNGLMAALKKLNKNADLIYSAMSDFGTGLAEFLNELITPELFEEVGTLIGERLNSQLAFLDNFNEHFSFTNFGESIAAGISAVFIKYDWEKFGAVLGLFAKNILRSLNTAAKRIQWKNIGSHIADGINKFFQEFQFTDLADTANEFLKGILEGIIALGEEITWEDIGDNIGDGVEKFLKDFDALTQLAVAFRIFVNGIFAAMTSFFLKVNFGSLLEIVKTKLSTALGEIHFAEIGTEIINTIWTALNGDEMTEGQKADALSSFSSLETTLGNIASFTFDAIDDFYHNLLVPIGNWFLGDGLPGLADIITNTFSGVDWKNLRDGLERFWEGLSRFVIGIGEGLINFFKDVSKMPLIGWLLNALGDALGVMGDGLSKMPTDLLNAIGEGLGAVLFAVATYKVTSMMASGIQSLAGVIPTFINALSGNPLAIIAVAGAIGTGIYSLWKSAHEITVDQAIADAADAITELSNTLSSTEISEDTDYAYINSVLDQYLQLNEKLQEDGALSGADKTKFESLHETLIQYCGEMAEALGTVEGGYKGTREELEALLKKEYDHRKVDTLSKFWNQYFEEYTKAELALDEYEAGIENELMAIAQEQLQNKQAFGESVGDDSWANIKITTEDIRNLMLAMSGVDRETLNFSVDWETLAALFEQSEYTLTGSAMGWENYNASIKTSQESLDEAQTHMDNIDNKINELTGTTKEAATTVAESSEYTAEEFNKGAEKVTAAAGGMRKGIDDATQGISDDLNAHENDGSNFITRLFGFASESARGEGHVFTEVVGEVLKTNKDNLDDHSEDGKPYGDSMIGSIITGVKGRWESLKQGMRDTAAAASGAYADEMGIANGSSSVMEGAGKDTVKGIETGTSDRKSQLLSIFEELPSNMMDMMGDLMTEFRFPGRIIISGIRYGINDNKQALFDHLAGLVPTMAAQFSGLNATMWTIGHNAMQCLANGLRSVHIPRPVFGVGTSWANAAGVAFPIPSVNVTWMASGAVIPRNSAKFLAGLGDNNHETEVVSPISTMKQAVSEVLLEMGITGNSGVNRGPIKVQVNRRTIFEETMAEARERMDRTGINPFELGTT